MDITSIIGLFLGVFAVFGGGMLEGLPLGALLQLNAFIIVILGSIGAMLLSTPTETLIKGVVNLKELFVFDTTKTKIMEDVILSCAETARKDGLIALEAKLDDIPDEFFRRALNCAVDGMDIEQINEIMETEIHTNEEKEMDSGKMWEVCGGYAPTIGIVGAVLGLIHVMESLGKEGGGESLGAGIAVAFVATIYGVGSANLIFIPFGGKLKARAAAKRKLREMMLRGVISIAQGKHPMIIKEELKSFQ